MFVESPRRWLKALPRWLRRGLIHLMSTAVLLVALEALAAWMLKHAPPVQEAPVVVRPNVAERKHTKYDPLLGWVNMPGVVVSNMYGDGRHLHINNLGFRGSDVVNATATTARARIILSGDSFTLGYGVSDDMTWGVHLGKLVRDVEVLNMGQGGYGIGQTYLWYRRDGHPLPHDVHMFAFITEDFRRMTRPRFMGYGKPVVTARNGKLSVENVPPPWPDERRRTASWLQGRVGRMNIVRLVNARVMEMRMRHAEHWMRSAEDTARLLFSDLAAMHREGGRVGVLVYLPIKGDYAGKDSDGWREWLRGYARANGWSFMDLVAEMRKLPKEQISRMFIGNDSRYSGAAGHYTEHGNAWVAATVCRLAMLDAVLFARLEGAPSSPARQPPGGREIR